MQYIIDIFSNVVARTQQDVGTSGEILSVLITILLMSLYEFIVYRVVSHRSMYNKSFHTSLLVIPFFVGAIIMALQSNLIITLGTIGALAIIRFRTAIKDPTDMLYLLWSIFVGISCGCQLYKLCMLTSLIVTIVIVSVNLLDAKIFKSPYILVINSSTNIEKKLSNVFKFNTKNVKLKSKNFCSEGIDYVFQLETKNYDKLVDELHKINEINRYSILSYDTDDVI